MKSGNIHTFRIYMCHRYFLTALAFVVLIWMIFPSRGACHQEAGASLKGKGFHLVINRPEGELYYTWVALVYTEVFSRLAIPLKIEYYPLKRASEEANAGRVDGESGRIYTYGASYPNLMRVEEPVFSMTVVAYTADSSIPELNGWESLKDTDYFVEYPQGMKICENNLPKVVKAEQLSTITETLQGLRKLAANRIDLYVDDMNAICSVLRKPEYDLQRKIRVAGSMETVPLYMYVHKKHQSLVPNLAEVIKAMKTEGLIEQYRKTAFGSSDDEQ